MLEAKVDKEIRVKACGDIMEIAMEISAIINGIYTATQDEEEKLLFKRYIQICVQEGTPTWSYKQQGGKAQHVYIKFLEPGEGGQDDD